MALEHLKCKTKEQLTEEERNVLAWAALMDFGFEFCMQTFRQARPDEDPLEGFRRAFRRKSEEHGRANEAMLRRLSKVHG
ncbi:MAG: hypothetical protein HYY17_13900 [Planctomycetes bacterium]|nr:hypothetical protein [Planctomycetota bacterium]